MKKFTKRFQVWERSDVNYILKEYDSLEEGILDLRFTDDWYVTEAFSEYGESIRINNFDHPKKPTKPEVA